MRILRSSLAGALSASLAVSPVPGLGQTPRFAPAAVPGRPVVRAPYRPQIQGDERILHALNRFTFGPRPGDLNAVRSLGLDRWFEQQLHPETIENSDLQARLAEYPAMQWSPQDLLF